jgi:Peroxiredoxin
MASTMRHQSWQLQLPSRVGGSYYVGASKNIFIQRALAGPYTPVRYSDMASTKLGGNPVNTNGSLPTTNSPAPSFTLVKDDLSEVTNADLAGKRVVLNIFPQLTHQLVPKACANSTSWPVL